MERYEINKWMAQTKQSLMDLENAIEPSVLLKQLESLQAQMQDPKFWNDSLKAKKVTQEANIITSKLESLQSLNAQFKDIEIWSEEAEEEDESWDILESEIKDLSKKLKRFEIEILLSNPYDHHHAILEIHPGAGGTESQDWADMLFRMYQRYAQRKNYKVEILDYLAGEEAGIKSVTLSIKGLYAYGYLKAEHGVHRLVRISPFDSNQRRHTSFASVEVLPEIDDDVSIEIKDEDIKIDVFRSSGAGGQSVNTTDSAVRITHLPTNIIVSCQNERSQIKNRETAMSILKSKLVQEEIKRQEAELKAIKGDQQSIGWGSQIRSYVFHPYQMVKDHRTDHETALVQDVMDGAIESFITAYLKQF
jgi:peptide chain release factor 2